MIAPSKDMIISISMNELNLFITEKAQSQSNRLNEMLNNEAKQ